ncbi:MAG: fibrobacter succinogenes major paralogous domain-containing protein [Nitrospirota bacterium]
MFTKKTKIFLLLIAMLSVITLTACGGGSGGGSSDSGSGDGGGGATTVTDIDGNVYNTVTIGTQEWMKENLKVTKYRNGDAIPTTTSSIPNDSTSKYQWAYNNDESNVPVYGRLYTWYAVMDNSNSRGGVCPTGWHVPTDPEWTTLTTYLGGEDVAGGKMKEAGTAHWSSSSTSDDNSSGFTALPGGFRYGNGAFSNISLSGFWWSATEINAALAWSRHLFYSNTNASRSHNSKYDGFSVRCVRDLLAKIPV